MALFAFLPPSRQGYIQTAWATPCPLTLWVLLWQPRLCQGFSCCASSNSCPPVMLEFGDFEPMVYPKKRRLASIRLQKSLVLSLGALLRIPKPSPQLKNLPVCWKTGRKQIKDRLRDHFFFGGKSTPGIAQRLLLGVLRGLCSSRN